MRPTDLRPRVSKNPARGYGRRRITERASTNRVAEEATHHSMKQSAAELTRSPTRFAGFERGRPAKPTGLGSRGLRDTAALNRPGDNVIVGVTKRRPVLQAAPMKELRSRSSIWKISLPANQSGYLLILQQRFERCSKSEGSLCLTMNQHRVIPDG